jgi:hypothetical protein
MHLACKMFLNFSPTKKKVFLHDAFGAQKVSNFAKPKKVFLHDAFGGKKFPTLQTFHEPKKSFVRNAFGVQKVSKLSPTKKSFRARCIWRAKCFQLCKHFTSQKKFCPQCIWRAKCFVRDAFDVQKVSNFAHQKKFFVRECICRAKFRS